MFRVAISPDNGTATISYEDKTETVEVADFEDTWIDFEIGGDEYAIHFYDEWELQVSIYDREGENIFTQDWYKVLVNTF